MGNGPENPGNNLSVARIFSKTLHVGSVAGNKQTCYHSHNGGQGEIIPISEGIIDDGFGFCSHNFLSIKWNYTVMPIHSPREEPQARLTRGHSTEA